MTIVLEMGRNSNRMARTRRLPTSSKTSRGRYDQLVTLAGQGKEVPLVDDFPRAKPSNLEREKHATSRTWGANKIFEGAVERVN